MRFFQSFVDLQERSIRNEKFREILAQATIVLSLNEAHSAIRVHRELVANKQQEAVDAMDARSVWTLVIAPKASSLRRGQDTVGWPFSHTPAHVSIAHWVLVQTRYSGALKKSACGQRSAGTGREQEQEPLNGLWALENARRAEKKWKILPNSWIQREILPQDFFI